MSWQKLLELHRPCSTFKRQVAGLALVHFLPLLTWGIVNGNATLSPFYKNHNTDNNGTKTATTNSASG